MNDIKVKNRRVNKKKALIMILLGITILGVINRTWAYVDEQIKIKAEQERLAEEKRKAEEEKKKYMVGVSHEAKKYSYDAKIVSEKLSKYDYSNNGEKVVFLTFDDGTSTTVTPKILKTLKDENVKATFFVVGNYIETSPDLINRMVEEGHIVGNHTYHHPDMSKISDITSFQKELEDLEALYQQTTGQEMQKLYRPPQGKFSESNLKQASELGYKTVFWSLAYVDWYVDNQPTREEALEKLLPRVHPGAVILLHSTSKTNAEILDEFLTALEEQGYTFGTLNDIV